MEIAYQFCYTELDDISQLSESDQSLLRQAIQATEGAYCPYSRFQVGAALQLSNGIVVTGNNQENIAYPSGMCAERVAMFSASSQYPDAAFLTMALIARDSDGRLVEASPCGACRQVLNELLGKDTPIYLSNGVPTLCSNIVDLIYPVGSIYTSVSSISPATLFGGEWEEIKGRFLVAQGNNGASGNELLNLTAGETGGETAHNLTVEELPSHSHSFSYAQYGRTSGSDTASALQYTGATKQTDNTGSGWSHNNLPPYLAVYMWKRTA